MQLVVVVGQFIHVYAINIMHNVITNIHLFMGHLSVWQHKSKTKFQRRTIGGSNNDASLEVRSSTKRYVFTRGTYKPELRSHCLLKTIPVQE